MLRLSIFVVALQYSAFLNLPVANGFSVTVNPGRAQRKKSQRTTTTSLRSSKKSDEEEERRMELVRNLQSMYYKSDNGRDPPFLDESTGILYNLPLWRVPWTELPGRSNVLNVHEPTYTNMFETILNNSHRNQSSSASSSSPPLYFGHLFLPGGSVSLRSNARPSQLKDWRDEARCVDPPAETRTAVVGTLMRIVDYRRMQDGRLCLLVHAMDRFVVHEAVQNLPYSIAHVQILPDGEETSAAAAQTTTPIIAMMEAEAAPMRAKAVVKSFQYHDYEYKKIPLPLPKEDKYMSQAQVYGSHLVSVLPFVSYNLKNESSLPTVDALTSTDSSSEKATTPPKPPGGRVELSLEARLINSEILKAPPMHHDVVACPRRANSDLSNDELERRVWSAMEEFCVAANFVPPPQILCLLPPDALWKKKGAAPHPRVSESYPASRRQTRFSFAACAVLEATEAGGTDLRQDWLQTPSTRERLADLLERFEVLNAKTLGEFQ